MFSFCNLNLALAITIILVMRNYKCVAEKRSAKDSIAIPKTELGMAPKAEKNKEHMMETTSRSKKDWYHHHQNQESEQEDEGDDPDLQMVTIDLSALRPSLPGLVLHRYGDMAPKLVQIDLDSLNPELQPHIIWPQFQQQIGDLDESYFDFVQENLGSGGAIPHLRDEDSLIPMHNQRFAKITTAEPDWPNLKDLADGDIYDFLPDSFRNEEMMILQQSLPLADEVIVPLDWEEDRQKTNKGKVTAEDKGKRNVFVSQGWKPGGYPQRKGIESVSSRPKPGGSTIKDLPDTRYRSLFGTNGWRPGKRRHPYSINKNLEREEPEDIVMKTPSRRHVPPKNIKYVGPQYPRGRKPATMEKISGKDSQNKDSGVVKISAQESWIRPQLQWGIPKLFVTYQKSTN